MTVVLIDGRVFPPYLGSYGFCSVHNDVALNAQTSDQKERQIQTQDGDASRHLYSLLAEGPCGHNSSSPLIFPIFKVYKDW